jgi:hypothetical protein
MATSATATAPTPAEQPAVAERLVPSIVAGQIAGLVMAVVVMLVFTIFLGKGPLHPVQVIGSLIFGEPALHGLHVGALVAGLLLHQGGPALFWSLVFGWALHALHLEDGARLLALGLCVGVLSQVIDVNLILPPVMRGLHGRDLWAAEVPAFWSWAAHVVYGLALALAYPPVRRRFAV